MKSELKLVVENRLNKDDKNRLLKEIIDFIQYKYYS